MQYIEIYTFDGFNIYLTKRLHKLNVYEIYTTENNKINEHIATFELVTHFQFTLTNIIIEKYAVKALVIIRPTYNMNDEKQDYMFLQNKNLNVDDYATYIKKLFEIHNASL